MYHVCAFAWSVVWHGCSFSHWDLILLIHGIDMGQLIYLENAGRVTNWGAVQYVDCGSDGKATAAGWHSVARKHSTAMATAAHRTASSPPCSSHLDFSNLPLVWGKLWISDAWGKCKRRLWVMRFKNRLRANASGVQKPLAKKIILKSWSDTGQHVDWGVFVQTPSLQASKHHIWSKPLQISLKKE